MDWNEIVPFIFAVAVGILGAYITVKIAVAELKKDISHLNEKLVTEIVNKTANEEAHNSNMQEVRDDMKAIFRTLTKIQVDVAKGQGRDEMMGAVKDAVLTIAGSKKTG